MIRTLIAGFALSCAGLVSGQAKAQTPDVASCGLVAEYVMDLSYDQGFEMVQGPQGTNSVQDNHCLMTDLEITVAPGMIVKVDQVIWFGNGLEGWVRGEGWPTFLLFEFKGARVSFETEQNRAINWVLSVQKKRQAAMGGLDIRWDPATGRLELRDGFLRSRSNIARLSGAITGVSQDDLMGSLPNLFIEYLKAEVQMDGGFEDLLLLALIGALPGAENDPETAFNGFKDTLRDLISALPMPQVDAPSKTALIHFVDTLPTPTGQLRVELEGPPGGVHVLKALPLVPGFSGNWAEQFSAQLRYVLGDGRLTFGWRPGIRLR